MRKIDRQKNDMAFPKLYYPELYLLEGGYKAFYKQFPVSIHNFKHLDSVIVVYTENECVQLQVLMLLFLLSESV